MTETTDTGAGRGAGSHGEEEESMARKGYGPTTSTEPLPASSRLLRYGRIEAWVGNEAGTTSDGARRYLPIAPEARFTRVEHAIAWADREYPEAGIVTLTIYSDWNGWRPRPAGRRIAGVWEQVPGAAPAPAPRMSAEELQEAVREAKAREAVDPHRIVIEGSDEDEHGHEIECACGQTLRGRTRGYALGAWRRHRTTAAIHAAHL